MLSRTQKFPLARFAAFQTQQLDQAREVMAKVYCDHSLNFTSGCHNLNLEVREVHLPHSAMISSSYGAWVKASVGEPESLFACQYLLSGNATYKIGTEQIRCHRNRGAMISPTKSVDMEHTPDSWILGMRIDRKELEEHLESLTMRSLTKPLEFDGRMDVRAGLGSHLFRQIRFMADELDREESGLLKGPLALTDFEQSVMTCLLLGQPHNYSRYLLSSRNAAAPRQVTLVEEYLVAHAEEAINIGALAKEIGYSFSAIYKGFQQFRGYTPLNFLKRTRLVNFRKRLLEGSPDVTLTKLATDLGFTHLGRLSSDYKKQFGELPSDTLRKARDGGNASSLVARQGVSVCSPFRQEDAEIRKGRKPFSFPFLRA